MQTVPGRWLAALHSRDFRLLWISELISAIGNAMFEVALYWHKNTLKVSCFPVIIHITCLNRFDGYIAVNIGCEEHGQLAEAFLSRTM